MNCCDLSIPPPFEGGGKGVVGKLIRGDNSFISPFIRGRNTTLGARHRFTCAIFMPYEKFSTFESSGI